MRTALAIVEKHEQIQDGLERQTLSGKIAEQMNQTLKGIMGVARLEMQFYNMALKYGRRAPVPRSSILRSLIGLPEKAASTDGETVRALIGEK